MCEAVGLGLFMMNQIVRQLPTGTSTTYSSIGTLYKGGKICTAGLKRLFATVSEPQLAGIVLTSEVNNGSSQRVIVVPEAQFETVVKSVPVTVAPVLHPEKRAEVPEAPDAVIEAEPPAAKMLPITAAESASLPKLRFNCPLLKLFCQMSTAAPLDVISALALPLKTVSDIMTEACVAMLLIVRSFKPDPSIITELRPTDETTGVIETAPLVTSVPFR